MINQVVQCEGEAAGDDLLRQDDGEQQAVAVLGFVAGHVVRQAIAIHRKRYRSHKR